MQFLQGVFVGVGGFTVGVLAGVFVGVGVGVFVGASVGVLAGVWVDWEESDDLDPSSPEIERHPEESRQAESRRAMRMNRVDFCIKMVFSPDLLIDSENVFVRMKGKPE
jgi:hypothetical protein